MDDQTKYRVISLLQQDEKPLDISAELDVSYGAVLKLKREFEQAKRDGMLDSLLNADKAVLAEVEEQLKDLPATVEATKELTKGLVGLERLSDDLQSTASLINVSIRQMIPSVVHASELEILADVLCKLQTSFINKNMTQVNVQNNFGNDTPKYNQFLGDKPGD